MSKHELNQIYLEMGSEIKRLSQSTMVVYRDASRDDAQQVVSELKPDIDQWVTMLNQQSISCYDLENLLESKRERIKLNRLKNKGFNPVELENFKTKIIGLITKSIRNTFLNSSFRPQTSMDNIIV